MFLCVEPCCCIMIDREFQDKIDLLNPHNCNEITFSQFNQGQQRCICTFPSSILSRGTGPVTCIKDELIDQGKYTWVNIHYWVTFY